MRTCPWLSSLGHLHSTGLTTISNAGGRKSKRVPCRSRLKGQFKSRYQMRGSVLFNGYQPARVGFFISHLDGLSGYCLITPPTIYP